MAEQLGRDAAEAEQHERAERRVVGDTDDRLDAGLRPSAARPRRPSRRRARPTIASNAARTVGRVAQIEHDAADVALVHDRAARPP